jgi:hypothetical protein
LALLPTAIVESSKAYVIKRRKEMLAQDFQAANEDTSPAFRYFVTSRGGVDALQRQVEEYMTQGFWLPLSVLLALNAAGLAIATEYVHEAPGSAYGSVVYTFLGAYLFNLGVIIRRLSLSDLNAQMLWGSVNRLVLATGLCLALKNVPVLVGQPQLFFAIGFLSNLFLEALLNSAEKIASIRRTKRSDGMSLQMVRGIDFWKAHRLEEEGIEDVQNLATADVLELAVRTHYNLLTLLDWIDQAILICRFRAKTCKLEQAGLNISAVDLAWSSPRYRGDRFVAEGIAKTLGLELEFVIAQMDSLYEDQSVRNLWVLWQTRPGYKTLPKSGRAPGPQGSDLDLP